MMQKTVKTGRKAVLALLLLLLSGMATAQTTTFKTGSVIIDMGSASPTVGNSIKPYGLIYSLLKNYNVPVSCVINPAKVKDGIDFTYNGRSYRGGSYIIPAEFRSSAVNTLLSSWASQGVLLTYTTSDLTLDVSFKLTFAPRWVMDKQNGSIAVAFLTAAGIPASAYSFKNPADLAGCDDIFVLPHADPTWAVHRNLYFWNRDYKGAIWAGCHAVSVLEATYKDTVISGVNTRIQMNFLSTTGLVNYGNHTKTPVTPFQHLNPADPMAQYIGSTDAAQLNGSEQNYLPLLGGAWRSGTKFISKAPSSLDIPGKSPGPTAINIYGRAFDDPSRGYVLYEGAHNVGGTTAASVAGQRIFFNFSFFALKDKATSTFTPAVSGVPAEMRAGTTYSGLTVNVTGSGVFTYQWKSSVAGTFSNPTGTTTTFTPSSTITSSTNCIITCVVTDNCSRSVFDSKGAVILPGATPITAAAITKTAQADCNTAQALVFNVFDNNVDANAGSRTLTAVTGFSHGTVSFDAAGNVTYTPASNYHGTDAGTYTISNGLSSGSASITIGVGDVTVVPALTNDAASAIEDNITVINVLSNDKNNSVATGYDKLYVRDITTRPTKGYVYINSNGTVSYLSSKDATSGTGSDSFKYLACNDQGYCSEATVSITISKDACTTGNYQTGINTGSTLDTSYYYATKDAYLNVKATTTNYGATNPMLLNGRNSRYPIMQFDLSSINTGTTINSAYLILSINTALSSTSLTSNNNPFPANIYQSRRAWTEAGVTWKTTGITSPSTINWSTSGALSSSNDYNSTNGGVQYLANSSVKAVGDTIQSNITSMVQGWITTPSSNNGLIMYSRTTSNSLDVKFYTKEASTASYRPVLRVVKTLAGTTYPCSAIPTTYKPIAYPDNATTTSAAAVTISVMSNDANYYGRTNTLSSVTVPAHGTAAVSGNNVLYTPSGNFVGVDTFTYTIQDGTNSTTNTATVRVVVTKVAPKIVPDTATTNSGTSVSINVGANDTDPQGSIGAPVITIAPQNGTATVTGGNIVYTPSAGFTGSDYLVYQRVGSSSGNCDAALSDTAIVRISVLNQPPVAANDDVTTLACVPLKINVLTNDSDPEGTSLTVTIVSNPSHGSVAVSTTGVVTYTPTANYTGTDQFTYKVTDGSSDALQSNVATVNITVSGSANVNHAPVAGNDADVALINQPVTTGVLDNDSDADNDDLTVNITAPGLQAPANGSISLLPNGSIQYTPNPGFTGTDTYQYQICDSHPDCGGTGSLCAIATVTITVKPIPVFLSGTVWDDANSSANGTFSNIFTSGESGSSGGGLLHVYVVSSSNVVLDEAIVDNDGNYLFINVPPNTSGMKLILTTEDVDVGTTLTAASLPSGFTNSSPLIRTGITSGTADLTGYDFGIGQFPVAVSYTFASQINTGSQITLDATNITGTDGDGNLVNVHYTSFPTNLTSIQIGATTYTSGTWPVSGVTVAVNTSVKILPLAGSVTPVISFKVIDNAGLESPSAATITAPVYVPLSAGTISGSATICGSGVPSTFSSTVAASGGRADIVYQWQSSTTSDFSSNVTDISSANSATYTPANTITSTTYFRRKVSTSVDGDLYSNIITVTINALPTITAKTDGSRTGSGTVTISATPSSGAAVDWYAAPTGGSALSTATNSYTTPSISATTTYYAQARNTTTGCLATPRTPVNAVIGTLNPGVIGTDQSQCGPGAPSTFSSVSDASGGTITYQWQSSTSSTFASGVVDLADDPSATTNVYDPSDDITVTTYYRRKATSGGNTAYSNIVTVTVNAVPASPSVTAAARTGAGSVTLSATVPAGITTDWYSVTDGGTVFLSGSANYTTSLSSSATYYVEARDLTSGCVSDARTSVMATINPNLSGGSISGGGNICGSGTPSAMSSATTALGGTGSYTYQWQVSTTSSTDGFSNIAGANALNYTPVSVISATTYYRRAVSTSVDAAVYSNVITFTVLSLPQVTITPSTKAITIGSSTSLIANGANSYIWSPGTSLSATNTASVTASPTSDIVYTVTGTDGNNCTNTATAAITINPALSAGSIAASQTICKNTSPAAFTSTAAGSGGTGTITYQWQSSTNNVSFADIPGATGVTYGAGALSQTTYFRRGARTASDAYIYTSSVTVTVQESNGGSISGATTVCAGNNNVPLTLSGITGTVTKWQSSSAADFSVNVLDIANTTTSLSASNLTSTTYYRAVVQVGVCPIAYSSTVTVTVNPLPAVTVTPSSAAITYGSNIVLTAGGANTYTWAPVTALSATNTVSVTASPTTDITYTVTGTDGNSCSNTATATITVNPALSAGSIAADQTICKNSSPAAFTSSVVASGGTGSITYQWQSSTNNISFTDIPGVTGATYGAGALTQTTYFRRGARTATDAYTYTGSVAVTVLESIGGTLAGSSTVCAGTNNVPLTLSGISGVITKWQSSTTADFSANVIDIANTTTSLSASNLTATTYYRAVVQAGTCAVAYSSAATVTVNPLPVVSITPSSPAITYGKNVTLTASGANTYTWTPITALSATNTISVTANPASTITYTVSGTDNNNCTNTATVTVTVNPLLTAGVIAADQSICTGTAPAAFTSTEDAAGGTGTRTYQWQSSTDNIHFADIPLTNSAGYTAGNLTQTTYYRRGVSTPNDDIAYTGSVAVTVNASAGGTISGTAAVCADQNSTVLTLNNKTGSVLKWQSSPVADFSSGVVDIANTTTTYTASNLSATTYYRAVVQNGLCPADNSATAAVTVNPKPVLTISPDVTINAGDNTSLTVSGATTYIWSPSTGLSDPTANTVTAAPAATTTYTVIGTSAASCSSSISVTVTVTPLPTILFPGQIQADQTICINTAAADLTSLAAAVAATGTVVYSWESSTDNLNFAPLGITTETLTPGTLTQTTYFRRKATDDYNLPAYSNSVKITVIESKGGTTSGAATVCAGNNSTNLTVSDYTGTILKWQSSATSDFSSSNADIAETTAGITVTNINTDHYYRAVIQNASCDIVNSTAVKITAVSPPAVSISPTSFTVTAGTSTTINVSGNADNYLWTPSTALNTTSGSTVIASPTSTITYTVIGTKTVGACTSTATATVDVVLILTSGTIAADQTICTGTTPAAFTSTEDAAGGNGTRTYQWQSSTDNINFTNISSTNSAVYAPGALTQTTYYRRGVSTPNDPLIYTNSVKVTVLASAGGSLSPLTSTVCAGTNNVPISLTGLTGNVIKWQSSSAADFSSGVIDIANATTSYSASNLTSTTYYRAVVQNGSCATANSAVAAITVSPLPIISITPSSTTITSGASAVLTASGANTYSWIPSTGLSTTNTLSVTASPSGTTIYTVTGTNTGTGCINTATVTVNVNGALTPGQIGSPQTICVNTSPAALTSTTTATGGTGALSYTWQSSTDNINFVDIPAATAITYSPGALTQTTYYRRAVETPNDSRKYTGSVKITVESSIGGSAAGTATVCSGTNSSNLLLSGYTGSITKWQSSPVSDFSSGVLDIINTTASYTAENLTATTYYRAVVQQNSCPAATSNGVTVTVNSLPTVSVNGSAAAITTGQSTVLTASGANTYTWAPVTGLSASNTISVTASPTNTTVYTVTGLNTITNCSNTASFTVTVNPLLTPGSIGSPQTICIGTSPAALTSSTAAADGTGVISYQWQSSTDNTVFVDIPSATAITYAPGTLTQTTYYRRGASTPNDAAVYTGSVKITIVSSAGGSVSPLTATVCVGTNNTLISLTGITGNVVKWQSSPVADFSTGVLDIANTTAAITAANLTLTTYYRAVVQQGSCPVANSTVAAVTVNALPSVSINGTASVITTGQSTVLTASGADTYTWAPVTALSASNTISVTASPTNTIVYTVTGLNTVTNCSNTASFTVTVNGVLTPGSIGSTQTICIGSNASGLISAVDASGGIGTIVYQWQSSTDNITFVDIPAATAITYNPGTLTQTTYYRRGASTVNDAAVYTSSITITVKPLPVISISPATLTIPMGSSAVLTASGATSYTWTPTTGIVGASNTASITGKPGSTTTYTVTGVDTYSCSNTQTVTLTVASELQPDFGVTDVNVVLTGNVSTNDQTSAGSTYHTPIPLSGNPDGGVISLTGSGTYSFTGANVGVYHYNVPVCPSGQSVGCPVSLLQITVLDHTSSVNPPVANPDIVVTRQDVAVTSNVIANDKCANINCTLNAGSVTIVSIPKNGTAVPNTNGTISYTPAGGYSGLDSLVYSVCDNNQPTALCATTTVYYHILPTVIISKTMASDDYGATTSGGTITGNLLVNDRHSAGATLSVSSSGTVPANKGTIMVSANGAFTFTAAANFTGSVDVVYTTCGGTPQSCATATLHLLVLPLPIDAVNDDYTSTGIDGAKGGLTPVVLTNDKLNNAAVNISDVNLTITNNANITGLTFTSEGALSVPANTMEGTYTITYQICEKTRPDNCDTANVTIRIIRGLGIEAETICIHDVPYIRYKVTPNFTAGTTPVTIKWLNGDKSVLDAVSVQTNRPLVDTVLWPGAVLDSLGNPVDWPGWYVENGVWIQGSDGFEKTRPDAYMVISVNPTDTIRISYPPATPACAVSPENYTLLPGKIAADQTICEASSPAALTSVENASGGAGIISYKWESSTNNTDFTAIDTATRSEYAGGILSQTTYYRRKAITASGQYAYSDTVTITITPKPTGGVIAGPCSVPKNSHKTYRVSGATNATSYVWTLPDGWTGTSTADSIFVQAGNNGGTITVTPYNGTCAGATDSFTVSVIDYTRVTITGVPTTASGNANSAITVTVELFDVNGNRIHCSGGVATLCSNSGIFSPVIDNNDGTYTSQLSSSANDVTICGSVDSIPIEKKIVVTFTGPQGGIKGNGPILATETPKLTFTATAGRAPFTVIYRAGNNTKTDTLQNVTSGVPVGVSLIPETTLYTLVTVIDANGERRVDNFNRDTATIIVLAPKVVITLKADVPKLEVDSSWATKIHVRTKNIGTLDLFNSQAKLSLREVFPHPVTFILDSVTYDGATIVPNHSFDGEQNNDLFASLGKPGSRWNQSQQKSMYAYNRVPAQVNQDGIFQAPDGSAAFTVWNNAVAETAIAEMFTVNEDDDGNFMFGALSSLPVGAEANMILYLHVKPNGYTEPFVMQAVALGTGKTEEGTALTTSLSNDNEDVNLHPEVTKQGDPVPTMINLFPTAVLGTALNAGTPVLQGNGSYNVPMTFTVKNYGNVNLKSVNAYLNLSRMIGAPATFAITGPVTADGSLVPNTAFNGSSDSNLVAGNSQIGYNQTSVIRFTLNIAPHQLTALYQLQVTANGHSEDLNKTVTDLSTNGTDPDPDNNKIPSEHIITEIVINIPVPPLVPSQIGIQTGSTTSVLVSNCGSSGSQTIIPVTTSTGGLSPYQYQWQGSADNTSFTDIAGATAENYSITEATSDLYLRRATISGSLVAYSNSVRIQVFKITKPVITVTGSNVLTWNGSVTLTSSASAGYLWSNSSSLQSVAVTNAGRYSVRTTDANGCQSNSDDVLVMPPPPKTMDSAYIIGALNNPSNSGNQVTGLAGATINYYILSTGGTLVPVPVLPAVIGQFTYYVSQTVNGLESAIVPYKVTMLDPMTVADIQKVVSQAPQLQADGSFLVGFTFRTKNLRSELLDSIHIKDDLTKIFPASVQFQVVSIKASGELLANSLYNGNSNPELLSDRSKLAGLKTDSVQLQLRVTPNGFAGTLKNVAEQTVKSPYGISKILSNDPSVSNGLTTRAPTPFTIPLVSIFIPSGFSPNKDGTNDRFVITRPFTTTIQLEMFNRWGNLVYKSLDYKNEWDGRGNQPGTLLGQDLPDGTYYYIVLANDQATGAVQKFTGYITLKR